MGLIVRRFTLPHQHSDAICSLATFFVMNVVNLTNSFYFHVCVNLAGSSSLPQSALHVASLLLSFDVFAMLSFAEVIVNDSDPSFMTNTGEASQKISPVITSGIV